MTYVTAMHHFFASHEVSASSTLFVISSNLQHFLLNLSNDGDDASESDSELSELEERMDTGVGEDVLRPKFL